MVKIWFRMYTDKQLVGNEIFHYDGRFETDQFDEYIKFACGELDIPTPLVLDCHIQNFVRFNNCRFDQTDFVESIHFDQLVLENCPV